MKNKNSKRSSNKIPFSNETKQIKYEFIKFIESMTDNEFLDFIILFSCFVEYMDNLENEDEYGFEYEIEHEYEFDDAFDDDEDLPF